MKGHTTKWDAKSEKKGKKPKTHSTNKIYKMVNTITINYTYETQEHLALKFFCTKSVNIDLHLHLSFFLLHVRGLSVEYSQP